MMMKCLFQNQYMYRSWYEVLSNFDLYEARFEALLGEILFFARFSLIWQLGWLSEPNLELLGNCLFSTLAVLIF